MNDFNTTDLEGIVQELKPVPGTLPPVYMFGDILIGYDKLEQVKVLATIKFKNEPTQMSWPHKILNIFVNH